MNFRAHKHFIKQFDKLEQRQQVQVLNAIDLFIENPHSTKLRNHKLKGKWLGYSSISAGGDLRIHYKILEDGTVFFAAATGSHSDLY